MNREKFWLTTLVTASWLLLWGASTYVLADNWDALWSLPRFWPPVMLGVTVLATSLVGCLIWAWLENLWTRDRD